MNLGRIQVRGRDIHDDIPDEDLPWSSPHQGFGSGVEGVGKKESPRVGAFVFLHHQDDSLYHPQWEAGPATTDKKLPGFDENTAGHIDSAGNMHSHAMGENGDQNVVTTTHQSGTGTSVDTGGKETKANVDDYIHSVFGKNATMNGDDETVLTLNFKKIILKCDMLMAPKQMPGDPYKKDGSKPSALSKPKFDKPSGQTY